jgi:hypothetical protein
MSLYRRQKHFMQTVLNQGTVVVMDFPYLTIQAATLKGMIIGLLVEN